MAHTVTIMTCAGAHAPVPDGSGGTQPMKVSKGTGWWTVTWDKDSCPASNYNILWGYLANLPTYTLLNALCAAGTTGTYNWMNPQPDGNLYFLMVGVDSGTTESSWGKDSAGNHRKGSAASGMCTKTIRDNTPACP